MAKVSLGRRLASEALGCFFLFAGVIGSGVMGEQLAGGNVALALLANSMATGAILYVLIAMLGPVSGAHFNPAVSLAFVLRGEMRVRHGLAYMVVQIAAGVLGVWVVHLMFGLDVFQLSTKVRGEAGQWIGELVATFGLVFAILGLLHNRPASIPAGVALYIVAAYWFTSSTSFANPAITVVRSLTNSFTGIAPGDVPMFVLAQFAGAGLAIALARWLFDIDGDRPEPTLIR